MVRESKAARSGKQGHVLTDASLRGHDPLQTASLVLHILILLFFGCDRCVRRGSDLVSSVNETLCDQDEIPPQAQTCVLQCPNDCVMSQWSQWSTCSIVRRPFCLLLYPQGNILSEDQHTVSPKKYSCTFGHFSQVCDKTNNIYITVQNFGVGFWFPNVFEKSLVCSPRLHLLKIKNKVKSVILYNIVFYFNIF